jgi:hypothetical protein
MARFYGAVGYGESQEVRPGVWEDVVTEKLYFGNVVRNTRALREGEKVNLDLSVGNSIEIVADAYAHDHFHAMKYVMWAGKPWIVEEVTVEAPRLALRLGGIYNGPRPAESGESPSSPGSPSGL